MRALSSVMVAGAAALGLSLSLVTPARAQLSTPLDFGTANSFRWRNVGPAVMMGRVADIEGDPKNPKVLYVASAAGGIFKSINAGTTFFPIFDKEKVVSMGDIAIAPSDPNIIYVGTGEQNSRNSISPGGGVFKSTNGGQSWTFVGLEETQHIGRVVVDPRDPNVVYVAALGHTWGPNPERGVYKTTDGGQNWQLVKFVSPTAGFIDIAMDPSDPNTLFASSWERVRGPYFLKSGGPGSALWKTTDAGKTWTRVQGGGWPSTTLGRIGLAISPSNPKVIYANVEADTAPNPLKRGEKPDSSKRQKVNSGLYRSTDGGATWTQMYRNEGDARPFYYSQVRVDPKNADRVYWMSSVFRFSDDGGKTVRRGALPIHTDWHAMWIDPTDPEHFLIGDDGGIAITWDKGGTYDFPNVFAIGQFYDVSFDYQKPYRVCGGLQDNGSWCGPVKTRSRQGATNAEWFNVGGGDGFYTAQDPTDPDVIYSESQGGNISRLNLRTGERAQIRGGGFGRRGGGPMEDSLVVARGDTTKPETPEITKELARIRERIKLDSTSRLRFNWETPYFLSAHNPSTIYAGGNKVIKSTDRGDHFYPISPDLSAKDSTKIRVSTETTGGITIDATGAETFGTVVSLAESPIKPGLLFAGTDDGNLWVTHNDGGSWENLTGHAPGVPAGTYVSRIEPSHYDTALVYVSWDNHRNNDFKPYLYVSSDNGRTFASLVNNLPATGPAYVHVVREDPVNRNLLFVGTDVAPYVSTDRGKSWQKFAAGLPTVPVYDLKIHPRDRDLIAATHGRSIWVVNVAPLEQMTDSLMRQQVVAFAPTTAFQYSIGFIQAWNGNKFWVADNPAYGADIAYRVAGSGAADTTTTGDGNARDVVPGGGTDARRAAPRDSAVIVITDVKGDTVRVLSGPGRAGLHHVFWDLRAKPGPLGPAGLRDSIIAARRQQARDDSAKAAAAKDTTLAGLDTSAFTPQMMTRLRAMPAQARAQMLERYRAAPDSARQQMRERLAAGGPLGGQGGRGQGPGGGATASNLRPAEEPPGAAEAFGGAGRRGGFNFGRQGPNVAEGQYLVTITVAGRTVRQVVTVERIGTISEGDFFGQGDGHEP